MKKVLKWVGISVGGLVGLLIVLIVVLAGLGTVQQINKTYDIDVAAVEVPTDTDSIARGRHIVTLPPKTVTVAKRVLRVK